MKRLTFVEIDLDYCSLRFGTGACPAVISGDVRDKCFNTKATCPVRPSFQKEVVTLRFAVGTAYLAESGIDYVAACIEGVSFMLATVSLGENLGTRLRTHSLPSQKITVAASSIAARNTTGQRS